MTPRLAATLGPVVLMAVAFFGGALAFLVRTRRHGYPVLEGLDRRPHSVIATPFWTHYVISFITPVDRVLAAWRVSPHALTLTSLTLSFVTAAAIVAGYPGTGAWVFIVAGIFDVLDGRVARRSGRTSASGAFLDSVTDRWGEFVVLAGLALWLRASLLGLVAALLCTIGSQMVSYTRARGEALGIALKGGTMQRSERIILLCLGLFATEVVLATNVMDRFWPMTFALFVVGAWSTLTAVQRLISGARELDGAPRAPAVPARTRSPLADR